MIKVEDNPFSQVPAARIDMSEVQRVYHRQRRAKELNDAAQAKRDRKNAKRARDAHRTEQATA